jgi:chromosome segregation ATPase
MDDLEEIAPWRDRTEGRLATLENVAQERAGKISQHNEILIELRKDFEVQKRLMQAVREIQSDHTARLTRVEDGLTEVKADVSTIKGDVAKLKRDMTETKVGVHTIIALLNREIGDVAE